MAGRTLPTGIVIGRMRSLFEIFDFAVLFEEIPIYRFPPSVTAGSGR